MSEDAEWDAVTACEAERHAALRARLAMIEARFDRLEGSTFDLPAPCEPFAAELEAATAEVERARERLPEFLKRGGRPYATTLENAEPQGG